MMKGLVEKAALVVMGLSIEDPRGVTTFAEAFSSSSLDTVAATGRSFCREPKPRSSRC
jgi:hypothetical protein